MLALTDVGLIGVGLTGVGFIEVLGVVVMLVLSAPYVMSLALVFWDVWKK